MSRPGTTDAAVVDRAVAVAVDGIVALDDGQLGQTDRGAAVVHEAVAVVVERVGALPAALAERRVGKATGRSAWRSGVLVGLDRLADAVVEIAHRARRSAGRRPARRAAARTGRRGPRRRRSPTRRTSRRVRAARRCRCPRRPPPRASMPGPCTSFSTRSCGMKYAVCGPKTAIGLPFRVCSPASRSALLMALGNPRPDGPLAIASSSACSGGPVVSTGCRLAQSIAGLRGGIGRAEVRHVRRGIARA